MHGVATILSILMFLTAGAIWFLLSGGYRSTHVTDLSHPFSISVKAPVNHTYGGVFIIVEGSLDGSARLKICALGRDIALEGPGVAVAVGGRKSGFLISRLFISRLPQNLANSMYHSIAVLD